MDLDLGQSVKYNVKINGVEYPMDAPKAVYVNNFRKKLNKSEDEGVELFIELCVDHGLPKDVTESLDLVQLTRLAEGLTGSNEKK